LENTDFLPLRERLTLVIEATLRTRLLDRNDQIVVKQAANVKKDVLLEVKSTYAAEVNQ
jgi:hypothetical protein